MCENFLKSGFKIASPNILAGVVAKTKNPQAGEAPSKILESLTGGRVLKLTNMHGNGLR